MPIARSNGTVVTTVGEAPSVSHTAPAPVSRKLDTGVEVAQYDASKQNKGRDFEAEARGKVACVAFNAALASPGIAGLSFTNIDEYLALVRKAADASVAYTWEKQK